MEIDSHPQHFGSLGPWNKQEGGWAWLPHAWVYLVLHYPSLFSDCIPIPELWSCIFVANVPQKAPKKQQETFWMSTLTINDLSDYYLEGYQAKWFSKVRVGTPLLSNPVPWGAVPRPVGSSRRSSMACGTSSSSCWVAMVGFRRGKWTWSPEHARKNYGSFTDQKLKKLDFHASFSFSQRNCGFHKHNFRFGVKQRVDISWDLLQESDVPIGGMTHPHWEFGIS